MRSNVVLDAASRSGTLRGWCTLRLSVQATVVKLKLRGCSAGGRCLAVQLLLRGLGQAVCGTTTCRNSPTNSRVSSGCWLLRLWGVAIAVMMGVPETDPNVTFWRDDRGPDLPDGGPRKLRASYRTLNGWQLLEHVGLQVLPNSFRAWTTGRRGSPPGCGFTTAVFFHHAVEHSVKHGVVSGARCRRCPMGRQDVATRRSGSARGRAHVWGWTDHALRYLVHVRLMRWLGGACSYHVMHVGRHSSWVGTVRWHQALPRWQWGC